jgi:hypothetical protein
MAGFEMNGIRIDIPARKHVEWQPSEQSPMAGRPERRIRNL